MNEIKIKVKDGISDSIALTRVNKVIDMGFVSNNNTQYCYLTGFVDEIMVYCEKSKAGNHIFTVYRECEKV